jgi:site-specific recombinase XerD
MMKGMRPLSTEEVMAVSKSFSGPYALRNKALFVLGVRTGFRVSELLSLQVGDVLQHGQVVKQITVKRRNMKGKIEGRTIPLHIDAQTALASYLAQRQVGSAEPLFPSQKAPSEPITRIQAWRVLQEAYGANGLTGNLGTHAMRKSFARKVYQVSGHDLLSTQRALGHKSMSSTMSYLSFEQSAVDAAILA